MGIWLDKESYIRYGIGITVPILKPAEQLSPDTVCDAHPGDVGYPKGRQLVTPGRDDFIVNKDNT